MLNEQVARGIETTVNKLVRELESMSVEVTDDDLANVATVSAGNNEVVSSGSCMGTAVAAAAVQPASLTS